MSLIGETENAVIALALVALVIAVAYVYFGLRGFDPFAALNGIGGFLSGTDGRLYDLSGGAAGWPVNTPASSLAGFTADGTPTKSAASGYGFGGGGGGAF